MNEELKELAGAITAPTASNPLRAARSQLPASWSAGASTAEVYLVRSYTPEPRGCCFFSADA